MKILNFQSGIKLDLPGKTDFSKSNNDVSESSNYTSSDAGLCLQGQVFEKFKGVSNRS